MLRVGCAACFRAGNRYTSTQALIRLKQAHINVTRKRFFKYPLCALCFIGHRSGSPMFFGWPEDLGAPRLPISSGLGRPWREDGAVSASQVSGTLSILLRTIYIYRRLNKLVNDRWLCLEGKNATFTTSTPRPAPNRALPSTINVRVLRCACRPRQIPVEEACASATSTPSETGSHSCATQTEAFPSRECRGTRSAKETGTSPPLPAVPKLLPSVGLPSPLPA